MRAAFIAALADLADEHPEIVLLTGDLGFGVIEPFRDRHPDRFINCGCAEQNMIGVATGLAKGGFVPFVYSIANFAVFRPLEFIRNGPVYHRLPVRIIGVGREREYEHDGPTHWVEYGEDVRVLRAMRGDLITFAPETDALAVKLLRNLWNDPQPHYYSLSKHSR